MSVDTPAEERCPIDGAPMRRDVRPLELTYKACTTTVDMPGWYCDVCGEGIHRAEDMKVSDRAVNRLKAQADGLLGPNEVRRIRKRLGVSQREAGRLIGGGPNAFQKYESGELLASRALSNLLRILERHPDELRMLRDTAPDQAA